MSTLLLWYIRNENIYMDLDVPVFDALCRSIMEAYFQVATVSQAS